MGVGNVGMPLRDRSFSRRVLSAAHFGTCTTDALACRWALGSKAAEAWLVGCFGAEDSSRAASGKSLRDETSSLGGGQGKRA